MRAQKPIRGGLCTPHRYRPSPDNWGPTRVDSEYRLRFENIRCVAERLHDHVPFESVRAPNGTDTGSGPLPYSTGLGLPLSRALAKAGNGWLGLFDVVLSDDLSQRPLASADHGAAEGDSGSNEAVSSRWVLVAWCRVAKGQLATHCSLVARPPLPVYVPCRTADHLL